MSRTTLNVAHEHEDHALQPEQKLADAISHLNQHASEAHAKTLNEQDVSQYICDLLAELSMIASKANLVFLTYLIDVAHEEARIQAQDLERSYR